MHDISVFFCPSSHSLSAADYTGVQAVIAGMSIDSPQKEDRKSCGYEWESSPFHLPYFTQVSASMIPVSVERSAREGSQVATEGGAISTVAVLAVGRISRALAFSELAHAPVNGDKSVDSMAQESG